MEEFTANKAKTHFGDMLLKAQRSPIRISKNGKPVAVVISMDDYDSIEALKQELLKARVHRAKEELHAGRTINGEAFFDDLIDGLHD